MYRIKTEARSDARDAMQKREELEGGDGTSTAEVNTAVGKNIEEME